MKKNEKIMIGILVLITVIMIGVLVFAKAGIWKKSRDIITQEPKEGEEILKSADKIEIVFYDKYPQSETKVHKILDKSETDKYDYNIYTYNGLVNIIINKEEISLRDALLNNKITMDEIIAKANQDLKDKRINGDMYKDGGSMRYQYANYTIIKCHTLDGNRDVYIGMPDLNINNLEL